MKRFKDYQVDYMESLHLKRARLRKEQAHWSRRFWWTDVYEYTIWKYIDSLLKKNIGKDVDESYSKVVERAKTYHKAYYEKHGNRILKEFAEEFDNHPNKEHCPWDYALHARYGLIYNRHIYKYTIDSQNRIQLSNDYKASRTSKQIKHYTIRPWSREIKFYEVFHEWDRKEPILITKKTNPELYDQIFDMYCRSKYEDTFRIPTSYNPFRPERKFRLIQGEESVQVASFRKYKTLHKQSRQRRKLRQIDRFRLFKNIQYNMLSKEEMRIKEEKENDKIRLLQHGFDEESFKGEHYHGQKRKKKNV